LLISFVLCGAGALSRARIGFPLKNSFNTLETLNIAYLLNFDIKFSDIYY